MAVTREEELLNSLANGVPSDITPITREEQYLSYIGGGSYSYPLEPITRKEALLKSIAEKGVSGGGGGVTINNQNKTITENGTYTADSGYTGLGTVTVDVQASGGGENKFAEYISGKLTQITTKDLVGVTEIADYAFYHCKGLTAVSIPTTVTKLGLSVFSDCYNLISITIPKSIKSIPQECFRSSGLTNIIFEEGLESIDREAFYGCASLTNINIPKSVTYISNRAFSSSGLTSISIPEGITRIYTETFNGCKSLASAYLPSSITTMDTYVFHWCTALTEVTIKAITPPSIQTSTFNLCTALNKIIVPTGCANAYKSATNWSAYADIIVEEGA